MHLVYFDTFIVFVVTTEKVEAPQMQSVFLTSLYVINDGHLNQMHELLM